MSEQQKPSMGRIVIYVDGTRRRAPAIVTWIYADGNVNLTVFWNGAMPEPMGPVPYDPDGSAWTWHWPPRV